LQKNEPDLNSCEEEGNIGLHQEESTKVFMGEGGGGGGEKRDYRSRKGITMWSTKGQNTAGVKRKGFHKTWKMNIKINYCESWVGE